MNTSAEVTLPCFDGTYLFALKGKQIEELERVCGQGIAEIAGHLFAGTWRYGHVYQTLRLGLIGGGMGPVDSLGKVDTYVDGSPLANPDQDDAPAVLARKVVEAVFFGLPDIEKDDEKPGEAKAGKKKSA